MELDELDKKVKDAFKTVLVGEIIFSDSELVELCKKNLMSNYDQTLSVLELLELRAQRYFVIFVNITRKTENDSKDWLPELLDEYFILSGQRITANDFYSLMTTDVFPYIESDTAIFTSGQRYYNTFRCQALVPQKSMDMLYEICLNTLTNGEYEKSIAKENAYSRLTSDPSIQNDPNILMGLKLLARHYPDKFYKLIVRISESIDHLLNKENIDTVNNQLDLSLSEWFARVEKEIASIYRLNRSGTRGFSFGRMEPNFYYALLDNHLHLCISGFNLGQIVVQTLTYEVRFNDEVIKKDEILCSKNQQLYDQFSFICITTEEIDLTIDNFNLPRDGYKNLDVIIKVNGEVMCDSGQKLKRDFILFNATDYSKQITSHICKPGQYLVYCETYSNTITHRLSGRDVTPISGTNLYFIQTQDFDVFGSDNYKFTFLENPSVKNVEIAIKKGDATYHYRGCDYEISDEVMLEMPSKYDYRKIGLKIINNSIENGEQEAENVFISDQTAEIINDDKLTIVIYRHHFIENIPYEIRLFQMSNREIICETKYLIYIKGFSVSYSEELFVDGCVSYKISSEGARDVEDVVKIVNDDAVVRAPYLDGYLILNNTPLLQVKIGSSPYKLCSNYPEHIYCDEIPDLCSISIKPDNMVFDVMVGRIVVSDKSHFGSYVHSEKNNPHGQNRIISIWPKSDSIHNPICLTTVHYKPIFLRSPIKQIKDENRTIIQWNPDGFIGPKVNDSSFMVTIEYLKNRDCEKTNLKPYYFGSTKKNIVGFDELGYGKYRFEVFINDEFSISKNQEPPMWSRIVNVEPMEAYDYDDEEAIGNIVFDNKLVGPIDSDDMLQKIDFISFKYFSSDFLPESNYDLDSDDDYGSDDDYDDESEATIGSKYEVQGFSIHYSKLRSGYNQGRYFEKEYIGDLYANINGEYKKILSIDGYEIKHVVWKIRHYEGEPDKDLEIRCVPKYMGDHELNKTLFNALPEFGLLRQKNGFALIVLDLYNEIHSLYSFNNGIKLYAPVIAITPNEKGVIECLTQ